MINHKLSNVGYIGLGNIGKPAALRLLRGSWKTHVYDVREDLQRELVECGASGSESPARLAAVCEHIGVCVRDDVQVDAVLYGAEGVLANARPGTLVAIHSTTSVGAVRRWAHDASGFGVALMDAAITGGAQGAEAGTLCYMVGGDAESVEKARPVFETSGNRTVHAGGVGAGMLLKLCNNLITYAEFLAMSEAASLAEAGGLSIDVLREVGLSNGVVNEAMYQFIANRNAYAAASSAQEMEAAFGAFGRLAEKDLECAAQSAKELDVYLPSTGRLRTLVYDLFMNRL